MNFAYIDILDYLSELPASFDQLASPEAVELFNKPPLRMPDQSIRENLSNLIGLGWIYSEPNIQANPISPVGETGVDIAQCKFGLTSLGGSIWESEYSPNWDKYLSVSISVDEPGFDLIELEAMYSEVLATIAEEISSIIVRSSLITLKPWNILYWKQLDCGYRLAIEVPPDSLSEDFWVCKRQKWCRSSPLLSGQNDRGSGLEQSEIDRD